MRYTSRSSLHSFPVMRVLTENSKLHNTHPLSTNNLRFDANSTAHLQTIQHCNFDTGIISTFYKLHQQSLKKGQLCEWILIQKLSDNYYLVWWRWNCVYWTTIKVLDKYNILHIYHYRNRVFNSNDIWNTIKKYSFNGRCWIFSKKKNGRCWILIWKSGFSRIRNIAFPWPVP